MVAAWRLVEENLAHTAFTGEGAARYGGRWNSRGAAVVYVSSTLSLAALETLVHLIPPVSIRYVAYRLEFDHALVEELPVDSLPPDWNAEPPVPPSKAIGDGWVRQARMAVLQVPSVIIPSESNYLLNPSYPDFVRIKMGKPKAFAFDPRLLTGRVRDCFPGAAIMGYGRFQSLGPSAVSPNPFHSSAPLIGNNAIPPPPSQGDKASPSLLKTARGEGTDRRYWSTPGHLPPARPFRAHSPPHRS